MVIAGLWLWLWLAVFVPVALHAQTAAPPSPEAPIDATKMGVSFDYLRRGLAEPEPTKTGGLKIAETIEVVGKAPKPFLWNPDTVKLTSQAVPFGAPTQKDVLKLITPKEFQNYPINLAALMQWLAEHMNKKSE